MKSIIEHNIYGLDIDERAAQLAYFSVMMKGRQYDSRFFRRGVQPHVYAIVESNHVDPYVVDYFCHGDAKLKAAMDTIICELHDAKEYGSIITVSEQDWPALYARFDEIQKKSDKVVYTDLALELRPMVEVAEALAQKYSVVVTNPPYMGASNMNPKLNSFIKKNYADYKSDFFSAFVIHCSEMTKASGYCGFFTPYVWMSIQSYEKMRQFLYAKTTIETLIQFEYSAFEEATVPVCTFAFNNRHVPNKKGEYIRLVDFRGGMEVQRQKTIEAIADHNCGHYYEQTTDNFSKIPGSPVAYWVSDAFYRTFDASKISDYASTNNGFTTGNNNKFLRLWFEVSTNKIDYNNPSLKSLKGNAAKWFPYNKGGDFRKWYGNNEYVINWENNGSEIKSYGHLVPRSMKYQFRESVTWNKITSGTNGFRYKSVGTMFDVGGLSMFANSHDELVYLMAVCNSVYVKKVLEIISPTLNCETGHVSSIPVVMKGKYQSTINDIAIDSIFLSREDWDSYETSWDFKHHPMLEKGKLVDAYTAWKADCESRFLQLKANEEELNRIFIDIYGLQDELTPDVSDKDITVHRIYDTKEDVPESMQGSKYIRTLRDEVVSLISYAVGCLFGRYSLDVEGLAYAGGEWDPSKYVSFPADKDNILPICDDEYFDDDIVGRFVEFVKTVYGADTLDENLKFIADALGGKGQPRDVIRSYFLNDFYKDHCKTYQKRPIYWLFDSGKKNGFKALIYMHRYEPDTIARIRTDYVHEQQARYRTAITDLETRIANASTSERVKLNKQLKKLKDQATEIHEYEEKIHHLADQMIAIDLDDGVKVNYAKFQDVLAKIK